MILGTLGYMSPEQVRGEPVDARADLFSFGAVLFEMLTGRRAFARDTPSDTMAAILRDDPPDLADTSRPIPPGLRPILDHCLEKQPARRFQSARDLAFALEKLAGGESAPSLAAPFAPAHRRITAIWAGALALLVLGADAWALQPRPLPPPVFTPLTINSDPVYAARFAPQGPSVYFSTFNIWTQTSHVQAVESGNLVPREILGPDARLLTTGPKGELGVLTGNRYRLRPDQPTGTLGRCPPAGALPRAITRDVVDMDWDAEGRMALVRQTGEFRCQLECPEGKVLVTEPQGWIAGLRFSPDGRRLACLRHPAGADDMGNVAVIELVSGQVRDLGPVWSSVQGLAWKGREIWFTASTGIVRDLCAVDLAGRWRKVQTTPTGFQLFDVAPDGRVLMAAADSETRILAFRPGHPESRELTIRNYSLIRAFDAALLPTRGRWRISGDGSQLFCSVFSFHSRLFLVEGLR